MFVTAAAKANGCLKFAMSLINSLAGGLAPNPVIAGILAVLSVAVSGWL